MLEYTLTPAEHQSKVPIITKVSFCKFIVVIVPDVDYRSMPEAIDRTFVLNVIDTNDGTGFHPFVPAK